MTRTPLRLAPPPLGIDFAAAPRRRAAVGPAGALLLVAGALVATFAALEVGALHEGVEAAERRLAGLRQAVARPRAGPSPSGEEVAAVWRIADAATQPWAALLHDLEAAATPRVALLSFEADPRNGRTLRIQAEAASAEDAYAYARRLGERPSFADVALVSHEDVQAGSRSLFAFTLALTWKTAR